MLEGRETTTWKDAMESICNEITWKSSCRASFFLHVASSMCNRTPGSQTNNNGPPQAPIPTGEYSVPGIGEESIKVNSSRCRGLQSAFLQ